MFKKYLLILKSNEYFRVIPFLCVNILAISWWIYAILPMRNVRGWPGCVLDIFSRNRDMLCAVNIWKACIPGHGLTSKIYRLVLLNFNLRQIVVQYWRTSILTVFHLIELIFVHVLSNVGVLDYPSQWVSNWIMTCVLRLIFSHSIC